MSANTHRYPAAFTLIEVLIVLAVIGVLAGMMVSSSSPNTHTQLNTVAGIVGREIEYARNLAVTNDDEYKIEFDVAGNRSILMHTGDNQSLDALPISPFHRSTDPLDEQVVALDDLPALGSAVKFYAVWSLSDPPEVVDDLEFSPLGSTSRETETLIWLTAGADAATRFISVRVNPVTGLYWVENFQASVPDMGAFTGL